MGEIRNRKKRLSFVRWPDCGPGEAAKFCNPKAPPLAFIPQRPYCPLGTLRTALLYPHPEQEAPDEKIRDILLRCGLEHLIPRIDETNQWGSLLSGSEQQRLAFARVLIRPPDILIMDEPTSSLDELSQSKIMPPRWAQSPSRSRRGRARAAPRARRGPAAAGCRRSRRRGADRGQDRLCGLIGAPRRVGWERSRAGAGTAPTTPRAPRALRHHDRRLMAGREDVAGRRAGLAPQRGSPSATALMPASLSRVSAVARPRAGVGDHRADLRVLQRRPGVADGVGGRSGRVVGDLPARVVDAERPRARRARRAPASRRPRPGGSPWRSR